MDDIAIALAHPTHGDCAMDRQDRLRDHVRQPTLRRVVATEQRIAMYQAVERDR
jgi:hypothetical protein